MPDAMKPRPAGARTWQRLRRSLLGAGLVLVLLDPSAAAADTPAMPDLDRNMDGRDDRAVVRVGDMCIFTWYWDTSPGTSEGLGSSSCGADGGATYLVPGTYVPGRYGRYEPAVWYEGSPGHFLKRVSGQVTWGEWGDDPTIVADYDGDGAVDPAVYRPGSPSVWYVHGSRGADIVTAFGEASDVAAPGDYDGDRRADLAVARTAPNGTLFFYFGLSGGGYGVVNFGEDSDYIIPGDFDGDGRSDITVTRDVGGILTWYTLGSRGGFSTMQFGNTATDMEVPADYDGDGRTDVAVWRTSSPGEFFIVMSSTGTVQRFLYGEGDTDVPVAGFNIHIPTPTGSTAAPARAAASAAVR